MLPDDKMGLIFYKRISINLLPSLNCFFYNPVKKTLSQLDYVTVDAFYTKTFLLFFNGMHWIYNMLEFVVHFKEFIF